MIGTLLGCLLILLVIIEEVRGGLLLRIEEGLKRGVALISSDLLLREHLLRLVRWGDHRLETCIGRILTLLLLQLVLLEVLMEGGLDSLRVRRSSCKADSLETTIIKGLIEIHYSFHQVSSHC